MIANGVFNRMIISNHRDIWIIAQLPAWGEKFRAMQMLRDLTKRMEDIKGVFATNADATLAAVAIAEETNSKFKVVGFDGTPEVKELVDRGKVSADVGQFPYKLGEEAIRCLRRFLGGEDVSSHIIVDVSIYSG